MYKSLLDTFNDKQMEVLRSKMWWVADQHKPMLVKFAVKDDFVLLRTPPHTQKSPTCGRSGLPDSASTLSCNIKTTTPTPSKSKTKKICYHCLNRFYPFLIAKRSTNSKSRAAKSISLSKNS